MPPTKKSVVSSVSTPALIFASHMEKTTGLATRTFGSHIAGPGLPITTLFDDEPVTKIDDPNYKANGIYFVRNDQGADKRFEYFVPNYSQGVTYAGLARINQSIEAYFRRQGKNTQHYSRRQWWCYRNTQREFLDRIEDSIVLKNISNSIQRYQEAIADTRTRLDFAVAQGVWLMPSRMVINTESIVGYNNMLVISDETMKLGINNNVNRESPKP